MKSTKQKKLFVDDNEPVLNLVIEFLKNCNIDIMTSETGTNGIKLALNNDIELTIRKLLISLLQECPFSSDNPIDCPLQKVRHLSFAKKIKYIDRFNGDECVEVFGKHLACLAKRKTEMI
ncbi:MAG TPA: hypothetical protein QF753_14425 [Victivallales bacterium]|nr:hypothetical protein [Victivallales bacterium]